MEPLLTAVICVLNSQYIHSSLAPWCLLAGVDAYCGENISATVAEGTINEDPNAVCHRIAGLKPDVIGFCCYIWNITETMELIRLIKKQLPNSVIVLGGPEVSYCAEKVLREQPFTDYVVSGEGEKPFAMLLNAISRKEKAKSIPGVCYRNGQITVISPPYVPQEEPISPYTQNYFNALNGRIAYLETSRGCPYSCAFCLSGRCGSARFYPMERAKRELLLLANSGAKTVKLVDRTFNANRGRADELFKFIIENYGTAIPKGVCFHFEIAGDLLEDETIRLLASAPVGSMQMEIGLQSFNSRTLSAINRKTNTERLKQNIQRLVSGGNMHIHIDLIAGLPYEDWNSFAQSFNTAYELKPNMLQLGFLKLLYGAPMREHPEQYPCRYSELPPYEVLETPWLSSEELARLHQTEDALERLYNSGRFRRTLNYVLGATSLTPFELFCRFGSFSAEKGTEKISLDRYTELVFGYFSSLSGIDRAVLRDLMACDRIATNASGKLPAALRIADAALKNTIRTVEAAAEFRAKKGIKRGYAMLYTKNCIVFADYINKNPVTGEFPLFYYELDRGAP